MINFGGIYFFHRTQQDLYELDDLAVFSSAENESGYSSRVETEQFVDPKENLVKEPIDCSISKNMQERLEQFYLYRRKRKSLYEGENKFDKLSDEIILMILKWLPKKCLVRITIKLINCLI